MRRVFVLVLAAISASGCSLDALPFVYKPDVHQGMVINQDMVNQLRAGMSRRQVQFILGSPSITDTFHPDRWDYLQGRKSAGEAFESKRISVFFQDDRLVRVEGDLKPQDPALLPSG